VAQFSEEPRDNPLSLRITQTEKERLDRALAEEKKDPRNKKMTPTALGQHLFALGLTTYEARDKAGVAKFSEIARAHGGDESEALADVLRRGFESWDAERTGTKGKK
jgi:hypothetical protein